MRRLLSGSSRMKRFRTARAIYLGLLFLPMMAAAGPGGDLDGSRDGPHSATLLYVSDYVSFVGSDDRGRVAFALDNNRGRDGSAYQAEHFVVLHDEQQGWISVQGTGAYPNRHHDLAAIPDSAYFQFLGSPLSGMTITSPTNQLTLRIDAVEPRLRRQHDGSMSWLGSAPAVLTWRDRRITGRVIYEYLLMEDFNRLTRSYWGLWKAYQGFYLLAGTGQDLYLHSHESDRLAPVIEPVAGFMVVGTGAELLREIRIEVVEKAWAPGLYRLPRRWQVTWTGKDGRGTLEVSLSDRRQAANWLIGGFAMGIVTGEMTYNGASWPLYGLGELIF